MREDDRRYFCRRNVETEETKERKTSRDIATVKGLETGSGNRNV